MALLDDLFDENFIDPEVEEYIDFMDADELDNTGFLTKKRVNEHFQECGEMLNLFMVYPDRFVDLITPKESHFRLFFFQRILNSTNRAKGLDSLRYRTLFMILHDNTYIQQTPPVFRVTVPKQHASC